MTPARYQLPWNPVGMSGLSDLVPGGYPLPHVPVGELPKSPDITMEMLELIPDSESSDCNGNGMGCGCASCNGMGDIAVPTWAATLPAPLNSAVMGIPVVYLGIAAIALVFFMGKRGRR